MANFLECRKAEVQHPRNPLLEAAPIGWQLFVLESGKSDSIAFLLLLATYATRLLAQALSHYRHTISSRTSPSELKCARKVREAYVIYCLDRDLIRDVDRASSRSLDACRKARHQGQRWVRPGRLRPVQHRRRGREVRTRNAWPMKLGIVEGALHSPISL